MISFPGSTLQADSGFAHHRLQNEKLDCGWELPLSLHSWGEAVHELRGAGLTVARMLPAEFPVLVSGGSVIMASDL